MAAFLLRRLLGLAGVLLGMSVLIFGIIHILPGNVAYAILGEFATPAAVWAPKRSLICSNCFIRSISTSIAQTAAWAWALRWFARSSRCTEER